MEGKHKMWLFALFVAVPIVEIALFIQVGGLIGLWQTLAIVVLTAIGGTMLLRTQGLQALGRLQSSVTDGKNPMDPIAHGALILIAAVMLLTPGFFTDAVGLLLLLPPVRSFLIKSGAQRFATKGFVFVNGQQMGQRPEPQPDPTIFDGEYEVVDSSETATKGTSGWTKKEE